MSRINNHYIFPTVVAILLLGVSFYPWLTRIHLKAAQFSCDFRDQVITLQWIHSVEREMWRESYQAEAEGLRLFRSQFKTFGAGTPYFESLSTQDGFVEMHPDLMMPQIYWVISHNVASTISTAQGEIPIHQYFDDYSEIVLSIQKNTIWTLLKDTCYDKFSASS